MWQRLWRNFCLLQVHDSILWAPPDSPRCPRLRTAQTSRRVLQVNCRTLRQTGKWTHHLYLVRWIKPSSWIIHTFQTCSAANHLLLSSPSAKAQVYERRWALRDWLGATLVPEIFQKIRKLVCVWGGVFLPVWLPLRFKAAWLTSPTAYSKRIGW